MSETVAAPPPDPAAAEARRYWAERFPPPRLGTPEGDATCWRFANICAGFDDASMARCLVQMRLRRVATVQRGAITWWQPTYFRSQFGSERESLGRLNRFIRGSRVFIMREHRATGAMIAPPSARDAPHVIPPPDQLLLVDVDSGDGAWRTCSGGAVGEDWISLGAFCWRCSRGRAAARIANICGYRRLPRVGELG